MLIVAKDYIFVKIMLLFIASIKYIESINIIMNINWKILYMKINWGTCIVFLNKIV
jgi:hypothetical protein